MKLRTERVPLSERFWGKVFTTKIGCWEWTGARHGAGYGMISAPRITHTKMAYAHRISWYLTYGVLPDDKEIMHRCDNPPCVRPTHLVKGSHLQNMKDRDSKHRRTALRGDFHPNSKLTSIDVTAIRMRKLNGEKVVSIAKDFKHVGLARVYEVANGKGWRP